MDTNKTSTDTNKKSIIDTLKISKPITGLLFIIGIGLFIVIIGCLFFGLGNYKPEEEGSQSGGGGGQSKITDNVFIIITIVGLILAFAIILIPDMKDLREFISQMPKLFYLILYVIFLVLFFRLLPSDILNSYGYIITPITLIFSVIFFTMAFKQDYLQDFNITYERIKMIILFFCLITLFIIFYVTDPGGYIKKYFGPSLMITMLLGAFSFLYLIILLTLPQKTTTASQIGKAGNFLENFTKFSFFGSFAFIALLILLTIGVLTFKGGVDGFFKDTNASSVVIVCAFILFILLGSGLIINLFPESVTSNTENSSKMSLFKRILLAILGLSLSGILIAWIAYSIQNFSGQSSITSFALNLALVLVIATLVYKTINVQLPVGNNKKNAFFDIIINLIFYIPCIFSGVIDFIVTQFSGQVQATNISSIILLLAAVGIIAAYFFMPSIPNLITLQGGKLLVNRAISLDSLNTIASYDDLNTTDNYDYQYGLSCWIFIDAMPPNTNSSYSNYTSLINYGNKPNILYNGSTNTLMITMNLTDSKVIVDPKDLDETGNRIIYKMKDIMLQKWNNIVINYSGGTLDVFYNNELVKSIDEIVPYMTRDTLTIGSDNGIKGGVCSVVYFKNPLTSSNMYYLYNMIKDRNPPIIEESSNKTILANDIQKIKEGTSKV